MEDARDERVARYADFAQHTAGQSACFEAWADGVATDDAVLNWIGALPVAKQQPNLVFAAARWHGVPAPGPYAGLREALLGDDGTIRATIEHRSTQTNEVGRLATLMPVLASVSRDAGAPLALLEVGTSAGLCLYPERYDYHWRGAGRLSGSGGPVLTCTVDGPMPVPLVPLRSVGGPGSIGTRSTSATPTRPPGWRRWSGRSSRIVASGWRRRWR